MRHGWWLALGLPLALGADAPDAVLPLYEPVRAALAADDLAKARTAATAMSTACSPELDAAAAAVASSTDLVSARSTFGELSRQTVRWYAAHPPPKGMAVFHCPMTSAWPYWLQPSAGIGNPYMGTSMPTCGEGVGLREAEKAAEKAP